jgi:NADH dehydrogenase
MDNVVITVFGGSGFIGRHVIRALAKKGHRLRVATRYPNLANHLPPMGHVGQIQLLKTNVRDAGQVEAALAGAQAAINLCGILYEWGEQSFDAIHIEAAETIGKCARARGLKSLVHVSSIGASETAPSAYSRSKAEGEKRLRAAFPDAVILRPSIVFGPEDQFFNRFARMAQFSPFLPLVGGGHTNFQPIFVGDVAAAVVKGLSDVSTAGKTYELGGPNIYSFKALMRFLLWEIERERLLVPIPFGIASFLAFFLQLLPSPLLTPDQVQSLRSDNVVAPGALTLADLGRAPTSVEAEAPAYLWRFRPKGQYQSVVDESVELQHPQ